MNKQLDIGFIKRVYRMSIIFWLVSLLFCWGLKSWQAAVGVTVGFVISVGSLMILERVVTTLFTPEQVSGGGKPVKRLMIVALLKYFVIGVLLWVSLAGKYADPIGIAVGVSLPYIVIMLKTLGMAISPDSGA